MRGRRRLLVAIAASCAVYAVPVVTVHFGDLFGLSLLREFRSDRAASWVAADVALAVTVQATWALVLWLALGVGWAAGVLAFFVAAVPATYAVNVAYLVRIPELFLIEEDATPDSGALTETCQAAAELDPAPAGITRALDARGEAFVRMPGGTSYGILRSSDCVIERVAIPDKPIAPGVNQLLSDGSLVYSVYERGVPGQTFWLLRRGSTDGIPLVPPPEAETSAFPLVSDDGQWVAWSLRSADRVASVFLQPVHGGDPIRFTHDLLQHATLTLVELDMARRILTVNRDLSTFVALGLDGNVAWGPLTPPEVAAQSTTFRYAGGQWLAWDAYVEGRPYRATWSTTNGTGTYRVPKGRTVTAASLARSGRYVAVSTTTDLNIGSVRDTVLVLRTDSGAEIFRKTLPRYSRSQVAFLGDGRFAYTDVDGATATVHVLTLPE
jgi:hypothetical protein